MGSFKWAVILGLLCCLGATSAADAQYADRQYYGNWRKHSRGYYYRHYYYKPAATYVGFRHHVVTYFPSRPKYYYYYNPYTRRYWGRCHANSNYGESLYSRLAKDDQRGRVDDIPERSFPKPSKVPPIPESDDGAEMDLPPDDLPTRVSESLPET